VQRIIWCVKAEMTGVVVSMPWLTLPSRPAAPTWPKYIQSEKFSCSTQSGL
jgi:hypothetical protein